MPYTHYTISPKFLMMDKENKWAVCHSQEKQSQDSIQRRSLHGNAEASIFLVSKHIFSFYDNTLKFQNNL